MADEHSFQTAFKAECVLWGAYVPSLVASMFMSGQPDIDITTKHGLMFKIENKYYRGQASPSTWQEMHSLLRGPQIAVIKQQYWRRNALVLIQAQLSTKPDLSCLCYKEQIGIANWKTFAKICALAKTREEVLYFLQ